MRSPGFALRQRASPLLREHHPPRDWRNIFRSCSDSGRETACSSS